MPMVDPPSESARVEPPAESPHSLGPVKSTRHGMSFNVALRRAFVVGKEYLLGSPTGMPRNRRGGAAVNQMPGVDDTVRHR